MTVAAFYIGLLLTVFMQLGVHSQRVEAQFWIIPSKVQVFEYESLSFECIGFDDLTGWKIMRKTKAKASSCGFAKWGVPDKMTCTIKDAFLEDSGEYWCETKGGERSNLVTITVSASVILESPVHPVIEGESVTLRCRTKVPSSNLTAEFFKSDLFIGSSETRELTIHGVSMCDAGFYKCKIEDESPESWLAVRAQPQWVHSSLDVVFLVFRDVLPVLMMVLILLLLAELNSWKYRDAELSSGLRDDKKPLKKNYGRQTTALTPRSVSTFDLPLGETYW